MAQMKTTIPLQLAALNNALDEGGMLEMKDSVKMLESQETEC